MGARPTQFGASGFGALTAMLVLSCSLLALGAPPTANNQLFRAPPNPYQTKVFQNMVWVSQTNRIYGLSFSDSKFSAAPCYENPTFTLLSAPTNGVLECRANDNESCQWIPVMVGVPISNDTVRFPYLNNAATLNNNKWAYTCTNGLMSSAGSLDGFTWKVANGDGEATATCTIQVVANGPPIANDIYRSCAPGTDTTFAVEFYDPDMQIKNFSNASAQVWSVKVLTPPTNGSFIATNGLLLTYVPAAGVTQGFDHFTYKVNDTVDDSANVATGTLQIRHPRDRAGNLVLLVVNTNLLEGALTNEINRLKGDLEHEGYTSRIKGWNLAASPWPSNLWNYLRSEYANPTQFLAGAILLGDLPQPSVTNFVATGPTTLTTNVFDTDLVFWNMQYFQTLQTNNQPRQIWVSRICWPGPAYGDYGDEVTLLRRALDANHDYRTGTSRLPHKAFYYYHRRHCDSDIAPAADRLKEVWPEAESRGGPLDVDALHCSFLADRTDLTNVYGLSYFGADCLAAGGELFEEVSDGETSYYMGTETFFFISDLYRTVNQVRFHLPFSCQMGRRGALANHMLMTRGGGCVFVVSTAGTGTTGENPYEHLISECSLDDRCFRKLIKAGESIGSAAIQYYAIRGVSNDREMFYGDMSLPVMAAPPNNVPQILSFTNSIPPGHSPVIVDFSVNASDPDGTISNIEWFLTGYDYGRAAPTFSGVSTNVSFAYPAPGTYKARVEVVDNYKARTWREAVVTVPAATNCTVTVVTSGSGSSSLGGLSPATRQLPLGTTTQIVYTASDWHRIQTLVSNNLAIGAAAGARSYTQALQDITADISNSVVFALATPSQTGYTNVPTGWLTNWAESAIISDPGFDVHAKYLIGLDPTTSNTFALTIESFAVSGSNAVTVLKRTLTGGVSPHGMRGQLLLQATEDLCLGFTNLPGTTVSGEGVFDTDNRRRYTNTLNGSQHFIRAVIR